MTDPRRVEYVPLDELVPADRNPKDHAIDVIDASISRFGYTTPIMVDERTGKMVEGHGRLETLTALRATGAEPPDGIGRDWSVPVLRGWSSKSDAEAAAYLIAANRLTELGGWDDKGLKELLDSLDDLDGVGFSLEDLDALAAKVSELPPTPITDPDHVPEIPKEPVSKLGDVWVLGNHKIACGDSTDSGVWERILAGARPTLVFTDPPYGIAYKAMRGGKAIENDGDATAALRVTQDALSLFHDAEAHFVCCDWRSLGTIIEAMENANIEPKATIVWDKQSRVQNLDRYAKQHEFIVYAGPYGGQPTECTDVWQHQRDFDPDHPTPKPVGLIQQALESASHSGALVVDAFGGSGSTLIACQVSGRVARLVELDPKYVDVTCKRFQEVTGKMPILESTGDVYDFVGPKV